MEMPEKISTQYNLIERFERNPILFLPEESVVSFEEVEQMRRKSGADILYACDFNIGGIEEFEKDGYFQREQIVNIDHHSESPNYRKYISSTNLAIEYVRSHPDFLLGSRALTHHTDCDSVLSTAIMSGILQPDGKFGIAAIAADHTGEANEIADLLQALKNGPDIKSESKKTSENNQANYLFMLRQLQNLLSGNELDKQAQELYETRLKERELLQSLIDDNRIEFVGNDQGVAYLENSQRKFDATLLIGLLPNSKIIFTAKRDEKGKTIVNVRLGLTASNLDLRKIMDAVQEPFGGRWNAGSNKRKGGSDSSPQDIARKIAGYLNLVNEKG